MGLNIGTSSIGKPPPQFYRRFERAMLIVFIPTTMFILQQWDFANKETALKLQLLISVGLTALVKGFGMIISDDEQYVVPTKTDDPNDQKPR